MESAADNACGAARLLEQVREHYKQQRPGNNTKSDDDPAPPKSSFGHFLFQDNQHPVQQIRRMSMANLQALPDGAQEALAPSSPGRKGMLRTADSSQQGNQTSRSVASGKVLVDDGEGPRSVPGERYLPMRVPYDVRYFQSVCSYQRQCLRSCYAMSRTDVRMVLAAAVAVPYARATQCPRMTLPGAYEEPSDQEARPRQRPVRVYREIKYKKAQSQCNLYQGCVFLYLISGAIGLRACYAMSGTDILYLLFRATSYVGAMGCPLLIYRTALYATC
eukprot:600024-Rhodomonas_salina.2